MTACEACTAALGTKPDLVPDMINAQRLLLTVLNGDRDAVRLVSSFVRPALELWLNQHVDYGVHHATHAAITGWLVASRLGWSADDCQRVFKAALTMNISMLELQGQLALQTTPPTDEQRRAIHAHPQFSRLMLEMAGVTDADWLQAVAQHHEAPDGSGGTLKLAGNPLKMSAFPDPTTRSPAPDLDADRQAILAYVGG